MSGEQLKTVAILYTTAFLTAYGAVKLLEKPTEYIADKFMTWFMNLK